MDARIRITGGDEVRETAELWDWLRRERALAGLVRAVPTPPADGQLGGVHEVLEVALGAGGAGAVVARALEVWLRTRRSDVTAEVTTMSEPPEPPAFADSRAILIGTSPPSRTRPTRLRRCRSCDGSPRGPGTTCCTPAAVAGSGCLRQTTGKVTDKQTKDGTGTDFDLTIACDWAHADTSTVDQAFYDAVATGSQVSLKLWKGRVMEISQQGHRYVVEYTPFLACARDPSGRQPSWSS
ncbi:MULTISPECIES: hypothetical protein [unclassified Kitasatospora]|uniref:effector-associated constant component EACC1 n=1 Tax=unclassified Kitasatospora TaxID=2633591 RepID=UPI0033F49784